MGKVITLGGRQSGGKWRTDQPMRAGHEPLDEGDDLHEIGTLDYVYNRGEAVPKSLHDERRRRKEEIERKGKDRL